MPQIKIEPQRVFDFPQPLAIERSDDKYLVIAPEVANYIVLDNARQLEIFERLASGSTVAEVYAEFAEQFRADFMQVLKEVIGKHFEDKTYSENYVQGMYMYLTNNCNQRCNHCYMYASTRQEDELTTAEVVATLKEFARHGGRVVTFTGGEATTRMDFIDIVAAAKASGLIVGLLTNGLRLTAEYVARLKDYVDEIQLSLDGYDAASYCEVRNTDSFNEVMRAIELVVAAGLRTTVAITPLQSTLIDHEADYIALATKLKEKYPGQIFIRFNTELMEGRNILPTEAENVAYRAAIKRIKQVVAPSSSAQGFALDHKGNIAFVNCGYGGLSIACNGDVYFCNLVAKCRCQGNIRSDSLATILERSARARVQSSVNNLRPCGNCALKFLCGGGCRVKSFSRLTQLDFTEPSDVQYIKRDEPCSLEYRTRLLRTMVDASRYMYR